jgi:tripartite-type tricarboxylate transporter receptor subunit TctC
MKCLKLDRRSSLVLFAATLAGGAGGMAQHARAEGFPAKPVQLIVPFPPGGAVDIVGRLIGKKLGDRLGQPVVIENKAGAGTVVGAGYVANATADGYTLLISSGSTFTVNPALQAKLPYDPVKSYEPIGMVARVPLILLANREVPVSNLKQLITAVQRTPDRYSYGSFGNGTTGHFAAELTWSAAGIKLMHVPYRGSSPAMADLMGGQIPFTIDTVAAALPQLKAGKIKAIAVTGATRATFCGLCCRLVAGRGGAARTARRRQGQAAQRAGRNPGRRRHPQQAGGQRAGARLCARRCRAGADRGRTAAHARDRAAGADPPGLSAAVGCF